MAWSDSPPSRLTVIARAADPTSAGPARARALGLPWRDGRRRGAGTVRAPWPLARHVAWPVPARALGRAQGPTRRLPARRPRGVGINCLVALEREAWHNELVGSADNRRLSLFQP